MATATRSPAFVAGSPLLAAAYALAVAVHAGALGAGRTSLEHPVAVATLLHEAGYPDAVVAAGLLHDTVEDGGVSLETLHTRFGDQVAGLVEQLTEDGSIASFRVRKARLRRRAAADGPDAAAIFAADKLATLTALEERDARPEPAKLEHYRRSCDALAKHHPEVVFLGDLRDALARLDERP